MITFTLYMICIFPAFIMVTMINIVNRYEDWDFKDLLPAAYTISKVEPCSDALLKISTV